MEKLLFPLFRHTFKDQSIQYVGEDIVVGGLNFLVFGLLRAVEYVRYKYLVYHIHSLCMYTATYIFSGPSAMTKGRPPITMLETGTQHKYR